MSKNNITVENARVFKLENGNYIVTESDILGIAESCGVDLFEAYGMILEANELFESTVDIVIEMSMTVSQLELKIDELEDALDNEKQKRDNEIRIRTLTNVINNYKKQLRDAKAKESGNEPEDKKSA
jgi:hypothetical protein